MDSSSESDTFDRPRGHRSRVRGSRIRPDSRFPRDTHVSDISDKIDTLANTLQVSCLHALSALLCTAGITAVFSFDMQDYAFVQDTSRNLNKVDQMLGQYKEHTDDQAEAMATVSIATQSCMGLSLISDKGVVLRACPVF